MTHRIALRTDYVAHAWRFVSTEKTRFYLNGVHVRAGYGGTMIEATDGHRLGMFRQSEGQAPLRNLILRLSKDALTACKPTAEELRSAWHRWLIVSYAETNGPESTKGYIVVGNEQDDVLNVTDLQSNLVKHVGGVGEIDGAFPDTGRGLPARVKPDDRLGKAPPMPCFNATYVASFGFAPWNEGRNAAGLKFIPGGCEADPIGVLNEDYPEFYGVLMPYRSSGHMRDERPDWLNFVPQAASTDSNTQ